MSGPLAGLEGLETLAALVLDNDLEELERALGARGLEARALQGLFGLAADKGILGAARVLARAGAQPGEDPRGARLLGDAARANDLAAFRELLAAGANVNDEGAPGRLLLVELCQEGARAFLEAALEAPGLDPAPGGRLLADWALEAGNWEGLEALEAAGRR